MRWLTKLLGLDEISVLRRKAKRANRLFFDICAGYSCGKSVCKEISPRAAQAAQEFNDCMDALSVLDPKFPKRWTRL